MDGKLTPIEAQILEAIDNGTLTDEILEGGLIALINEELKQNERPANMELIGACEDLLSRIHNHEYVSHKAESLRKAKAKLAKHYRRKTIYVTSLRTAAAVVLLIGGSLIADVLIRDKSLTDYSTVDEQQYIISGRVVEGPYDEAIADNDAFFTERHDATWQEVVDRFGYIPEIPTWLPEGWKLQDYYVSTSRYVSVLRLKYAHDKYKNLIKYSESHYTNVELAISSYEQNSNGELYQWNDLSVYLSTNTNESIAVWIKDATCYSISGPLTIDEMKLIINSIQRSDK